MTPIDWSLLARAKDFYAGLGYRYVETPWIAPVEACKATFHSPRFNVDNGCLVGSGEQGLLWLAHMGVVTAGKWMTITPCFRDEPKEDRYHQKQFMKLELMDFGQLTEAEDVARDANDCFTLLRPGKVFEVVPTPEGLDICRAGIELGSYGLREGFVYGRHYYWTYGTGLALPRFSQVD